MVAAFGPVFRYADDMGMKVYLLTDMLAVSPPLEALPAAAVGGLDMHRPRGSGRSTRPGLAELFDGDAVRRRR